MLLLFALMTQVQVQVSAPAVRFEAAPPMVEVQPGVMVVHDCNDEVFYTDGRYWTRSRDGRWYRANDHRGGWVAVEPRAVPERIERIPPGHYRHYRGRPEKLRVANADGSVTEYRVKEKHGVREVRVKEKKRGRWRR
jgi:hypothetical protein